MDRFQEAFIKIARPKGFILGLGRKFTSKARKLQRLEQKYQNASNSWLQNTVSPGVSREQAVAKAMEPTKGHGMLANANRVAKEGLKDHASGTWEQRPLRTGYKGLMRKAVPYDVAIRRDRVTMKVDRPMGQEHWSGPSQAMYGFDTTRGRGNSLARGVNVQDSVPIDRLAVHQNFKPGDVRKGQKIRAGRAVAQVTDASGNAKIVHELDRTTNLNHPAVKQQMEGYAADRRKIKGDNNATLQGLGPGGTIAPVSKVWPGQRVTPPNQSWMTGAPKPFVGSPSRAIGMRKQSAASDFVEWFSATHLG